MANDITFDIADVDTISFAIDGSGTIPSVTSVNGKTGTVVLTTSDLTNDSGYQTSANVSSAISTHNADTSAHSDIRSAIEGKYTKAETGIPKSDLSSAVQTSLGLADSALQEHQSLSGYATETWVENKGYLTEHQSLTNYSLISNTGYKLDLEMNSSTYVITPRMYDIDGNLISTGATIDLPMETMVVSASYNSSLKAIVLTLKNGQTITVPIEDIVSGLVSTSTFEEHTGNSNIHVSANEKGTWSAKYSKPNTGIPLSDLSASVQTSLGKADTALQNHQSLASYRTASAQDVIDTTKYEKPSGGIPKTDMSSAVQTSLGKADTSLQSVPLATSTTIGGAYVDEAQETDTQAVRINAQGKLVTAPGSGSVNAVQGVIFNGDELIKDANNRVSFNAITSHQSLSAYRTSADQDTIDATKYSKPEGGIPKSDLASSVQTSLGKADTSIQSLDGYATQVWVGQQGYLTEHQSLAAYRTSAAQDTIDAGKATTTDLNAHINSTSNPHSVTKAQVGLGNVPNTDFTSRVETLEGKTALSDFTDDLGSSPTHTHSQYALDSELTTAEGNITTLQTNVGTLQTSVATINGKIPSQATSSNQLADKNFVNSSIATETATFRGTYNSLEELQQYTGEKDNNDYAIVKTTDSTTGNQYFTRYKYVVPSSGTASWQWEFTINSTGFTSAQWSAITSGITSTLVTNYNTHIADTDIHVTANDKTSWNGKYTKPSTGIPSSDLASGVVNDTTVTIKKNDGTTIDSFTLNASSNKEITLPELGKVDDVQTKVSPSGSYATVVTNKVAQIDLSGFLTTSDNTPGTAVNINADTLDLKHASDFLQVGDTIVADQINTTVSDIESAVDDAF